MHRLLVESEELSCEAPSLSREALNHLKVLRPKDGEPIELFDGCGAWRICAFRRADGALVPTAEVCRAQPPVRGLTLFACVTKGARWDWTVEKATELGVTRLVPVISERTIVRVAADECAAKRVRWLRIAEEAARQSDAKWLPEIVEPVDFAASLALVRETACFVGALTSPPPKTIGAALREADVASVRDFAVFVGPEGDFTPAELAALLEIATPVSFGSTVLRAETAAIYGVSAVKAFLESLHTFASSLTRETTM